MDGSFKLAAGNKDGSSRNNRIKSERLTVKLFLTGDRTESNTTWSAGLNSPPESPPVEGSPITSTRTGAAGSGGGGGNNNKAIINLSSFGNSFTHLAVNPF